MNNLPQIPVLSIRQPWPWAILYAGKDIENRTWRTHFRGRFLIHASKGCTRDEYDYASAWIANQCGIKVPPLIELPRGGIVGEANLIDCVAASESPWYMGAWGFQLTDAKPLPFTPCTGARGFFRLENVEWRHPSQWLSHFSGRANRIVSHVLFGRFLPGIRIHRVRSPFPDQYKRQKYRVRNCG